MKNSKFNTSTHKTVEMVSFLLLVSSLLIVTVGCSSSNRKVMSKDPKLLQSKYESAIEHIKNNELNLAEKNLNEIIEVDEKFNDVQEQLEIVHSKKAEVVKNHFNEVMKAIDNSDFPDAQEKLNATVSKRKEYGINEKSINLSSEYQGKLIQLEKQYYYEQGMKEYNKGNNQKANELLKKVYDKDTAFKDTQYYFALSFARIGDFNKSIEYLSLIPKSNSHFSDSQKKIKQYKEKIRDLEIENIAENSNIQSDAGKKLIRDLGPAWSFSEYSDDMGRGLNIYAEVESSNTVDFDFPYEGVQHATLTLRRHSKYGQDVILEIEKGQFMCPMGCTVYVRFDDGKPISYSANGPSDNSTTFIFIGNYNRFYNGVKNAKRVQIEAEFYQEGQRLFEFDLSH